ncbi:MAG: alpha/beta hydrolase-fold protein [Bacteroidota bacterium]
MKKLIFSTVLLTAFFLHVNAQVTFIVSNLPENTPPEDNLYIAGDFTGWTPDSAEFLMHKNGQDKWTITLPQQPEETAILYKFTRGSWETVEKGANGEEIPNRSFSFGNGETVYVNILKWADHGGGTNSTAAENVTVLNEDFFMPQLNRFRRIWIYLPPDYETSGFNYPVIYMHDGQNLFDVLTAYSGEWEIDEALNTLASQGYKVPIVVGIDNGGTDRIAEYTPWSNLQYGGGDGDLYIRFITETLKPYIDQNYRSLADRDNTALMGSSLGGLISHYGALSYQPVFSKAGIFSPSYWYSDSVWSFTRQTGKQLEMRLYQLCGTLEGGNTVNNLLRMNDTLLMAGFQQSEIFTKVVTGGSHNEALWRANFTAAYLWLFESGASSIDESPEMNTVLCFPNPVENELSFYGLPLIRYDSVVISNPIGQPVKTISATTGNVVAVDDLKPGLYYIKFLKDNVLLGGKFIKK